MAKTTGKKNKVAAAPAVDNTAPSTETNGTTDSATDAADETNIDSDAVETVESLKEKNAALEKVIEEQSELIAELMDKNSKAPEAKSKYDSVNVDGTTYIIKAKSFKAFGVPYTSEKLSKNPALARVLLQKGCDLLVAKE